MFNRKVSTSIRNSSISFYRRCLKIIQRLEPNHQKIWYDYTRLKYEEYKDLKDEKRIKKIIEEGIEQIEWVSSLLRLKEK